LLLGLLLTFAVAAAVGLGATWLTLARGVAFGAITIGAWTAWPKTGTAEIDPYARAVLARSGELPLGLGDGVAFLATTDDGGRPLDGRCDIIVRGNTPQARFWTLTLYDPAGRLVANALERYGFTSQEIVRQSNGDFAIALAPRARPGNWLPTGGIERYLLALRLYDTPVGVAGRAMHTLSMPAINTEKCP